MTKLPIPQRTRRMRDWHHMLAMLIFMVLLSVGLFFLFMRIDFIPNAASRERVLIDHFVELAFAIASVFFSIIITVLGYALLFFRSDKDDEEYSKPIQGSAPLEITWTVIPLIIVVLLSIHGARVLDQMTAVSPNETYTQVVFSLGAFVPREIPPSGAATAGTVADVSTNTTVQPDLEVDVTAQRFVWTFAFPQYGVNTTYMLEVPVNRRIVFHLHSKDVIHDFWVQAWGPKEDVVPGLNTDLLITPTKLGDFTVMCNQLCGFGHTNMTAPVKVVTASEFDTWVKQQGGVTAVAPSDHVSFIQLAASHNAFSTNTITVAAGSQVQVAFTNNDAGVQHNFSVYTNSSATTSMFVGDSITGPKSVTYTFPAPMTPGTYYFRSDTQPTTMYGTFTVR